MKKLDDLLQNYVDEPVPALAPPRRKTLARADRDRLLRDLGRLQKGNQTMLWIVILMLIILFLVSIGIVLANLNEPATVKAASAALGISAAACVRWLLSIWREKSNSEIFLRLALSLEGDALKEVISILAEKSRPVQSQHE
jgi:hypothetical protein